jgi:hypothetical protein
MPASPKWLGLVLAVVAGTAGCASIKSTFVERDPADTMWMPSSPTMNGIPVTLQVPSYVKVQFVKRYWYSGATALTTLGGADGKTSVPLVTYDFRHEVIQQKKVVMVDFKRPAAGTFEFSGTIDKDTGYFTQIAHKGEDTTIATVGNLVNNILKTSLNRQANLADTGNTAASYAETVEATIFIKVTDPDFEQQLRQFVCCCQPNCCDGGHCPATVATGPGAGTPTPGPAGTPTPGLVLAKPRGKE